MTKNIDRNNFSEILYEFHSQINDTSNPIYLIDFNKTLLWLKLLIKPKFCPKFLNKCLFSIIQNSKLIR